MTPTFIFSCLLISSFSIISTYLLTRRSYKIILQKHFTSQEYELQKCSYRLSAKEKEHSLAKSNLILMEEELERRLRKIHILQDNLKEEISYSESLEMHLKTQKLKFVELKKHLDEEHLNRHRLEIERGQMAHLLHEEQKISRQMNQGIASLSEEIKELKSLPPSLNSLANQSTIPTSNTENHIQ